MRNIFSEIERVTQIWFTKSIFFNKLFQHMIRLILIIYSIGILIFFLNFSHLMIILLRIEFIYIILLLLLVLYLRILNILGIFIFLVRIVCEAGLGLRLLVIIRFYYGNEFTNSFNLIKC